MLIYFIGAVSAYLFFALVFALIPVHRSFESSAIGVDIFIISNGVHSEFVVPVQNSEIDWRTVFPIPPTNKNASYYSYIGIGWGDKGFYLETPTWKELKAKTAISALVLPSKSVVHLTGHRHPPVESEKCIGLRISPVSYQKLVTYIKASIALDDNAVAKIIPNQSYSKNDHFYEGVGAYSLLRTCNDWTNQGLKEAGVRAAFWSPFENGIFYQLRRIKS